MVNPVTDGRGDSIPNWVKNILPWIIQFGTIIWFLASLKGEVKYMNTTVTELKTNQEITREAVNGVRYQMGQLQVRVDNLDVRNR